MSFDAQIRYRPWSYQFKRSFSKRDLIAFIACLTALMTICLMGAGPDSSANKPVPESAPPAINPISPDVARTLQSVAVFTLAPLAGAAVLMMTSFVRMNIVLILLRQALGSPQVPGNQVLTVLSLLLTSVVMAPTLEQVYSQAIEPVASGKMQPAQAYEIGVKPIKRFMIAQIIKTKHQNYLWTMHHQIEPPSPGKVEPLEADDFSMRAVAPAYLISELQTALWIGFLIYLPFLVIDLVVSAVLAAMGLFMLPPALVSMPLKLVLFVLADGWMLVSGMLIRGFA